MQGVQEFLEKPIAGGIFAQITYKLVIEIVIALIVGAAVGVMFPTPEEPTIPAGNITHMTDNSIHYTSMYMCPPDCQLRSPQCPFDACRNRIPYFS